MDIRRGLVRAWLVLSLCWVAWVGFVNYDLYASFVEAQLWPERIKKDQDQVLANMAACIEKIPNDPDSVRKCLPFEEFQKMTRGSFPKRETLTMAIGAAGIGCVLLLFGFVWRGFRPR